MSETWKHIGTWVGLDRDGVVQAGHTVSDPGDEDAAREFVTAGSRTVLRVGPEVLVRLGFPLPAVGGHQMSPEPMSDFIREHTHNEYGAFLAYDLREWLLAAGWVPPEEAETLREELAELRDGAESVAHNEINRIQAELNTIRSSWVPPERVETIDCPRAEHGFQEHGAGPPASWVCPTCKNSGKLEIVTAE